MKILYFVLDCYLLSNIYLFIYLHGIAGHVPKTFRHNIVTDVYPIQV